MARSNIYKTTVHKGIWQYLWRYQTPEGYYSIGYTWQFTKEVADAIGLEYVDKGDWRWAQVGQYLLTDDNYVVELIHKHEFTRRNLDGTKKSRRILDTGCGVVSAHSTTPFNCVSKWGRKKPKNIFGYSKLIQIGNIFLPYKIWLFLKLWCETKDEVHSFIEAGLFNKPMQRSLLKGKSEKELVHKAIKKLFGRKDLNYAMARIVREQLKELNIDVKWVCQKYIDIVEDESSSEKAREVALARIATWLEMDEDNMPKLPGRRVEASGYFSGFDDRPKLPNVTDGKYEDIPYQEINEI